MNDDEYFAGAPRPPRSVVDEVNEKLAKQPRRRERSVQSESRAVRRLGDILDFCFWWVWWW
jgi:hypothetical protein